MNWLRIQKLLWHICLIFHQQCIFAHVGNFTTAPDLQHLSFDADEVYLNICIMNTDHIKVWLKNAVVSNHKYCKMCSFNLKPKGILDYISTNDLFTTFNICIKIKNLFQRLNEISYLCNNIPHTTLWLTMHPYLLPFSSCL